MKRIEHQLPLTCDIFALGDTHIGTKFCHTQGIQKVIALINESEHTRWLHMGDWISAIMTDDKRYQHDTIQEPIPLKQVKEVVKMFSPIASKCIVGLWGNHEAKLHRFGDLSEEICSQLGIPYGTYSARIIFKNEGKDLFKMFVTHGRWTFNSAAKDYEQRFANMKAMIKMKLKNKMSDCLIMLCGHAHKLLIVPPVKILTLRDGKDHVKQQYLEPKQTGDYLDPDLRFYGCTGSFEKLYVEGISSYAEVGGYDPIQLGCLRIRVHEGKVLGIDEVLV